jgi:hypothetical protein
VLGDGIAGAMVLVKDVNVAMSDRVHGKSSLIFEIVESCGW